MTPKLLKATKIIKYKIKYLTNFCVPVKYIKTKNNLHMRIPKTYIRYK